MADSQQTDSTLWRRALLRIYINGLIAVAVGFVFYKIVTEYSPWDEWVQNPLLATVLSIASIVVLPLALGLLVQYGINPILGKWSTGSQFVTLQDRIFGEISNRKNPDIVIINWPSESVRTVGVLTTRFPATESTPEMAAVYTVSAPGSKSGYMRIVAVTDIQFTDWTLKDFQLFQWTVGSVSPSQLHEHKP